MKNHTISALFVLALTGCAISTPPTSVALATPPQWYAPLPHQGNLANLSQWWQQQNDALLVSLIEAAQLVSPGIATARSNIEQARAQRTASQADLMPDLGATASFSRSRSAPQNQQAPAPTNLGQLGLQAQWELDLFGGKHATRNADQARLQGAQALWHDARVSVAAEVALQYYSFRACEKLLAVAQADSRSRSETARLSALVTKAGFEAPATAALARASAAESKSRASQQAALCDIDIKALVALTALPEPELRQKLEQSRPASSLVLAEASSQVMPAISSVPATVLEQRPDVFNAAREVAAASYDIGTAKALRYPNLSLSGSITTGKTRSGGISQGFNAWSVGPISLTGPLFDGGASLANIDAATARYEEASDKYRNTARQAVREVEEALVKLQSTGDRAADALVAAEGYNASFGGTEARYKAGLASLVELEDSRRNLLAAQSAVISLERERKNAWIALYRALGGGWSSAAADMPVQTSRSSQASQP
ncbi:MAG: efflux transporter outer membrane subunit [Pseudomonadota bacterium]